MTKLLIINASYKSNGVSSQVASLLKDHLLQKGTEFEVINLKDKNLLYCTNCRTCTQVQSSKPQMCILEDDFNAIVKQLESAQRFIFITPTNFYSVTALFKTFQERLIVYAYFPWGAQAPKYRKTKRTKKALLISS
ncbi:MAG: flavodoxin family protein, partial [Kosmotogaceae bacterium]